MKSPTDRGTPTVVVLGAPGLLRAAVTELLGQAGLPPVEPDEVLPPDTVAVLVEPVASDWALARGRGWGIVLVDSESQSRDHSIRLVLRGADAILALDTSPDELTDAVLAVRRGSTRFDSGQIRAVVEHARGQRGGLPELTPRERDILVFIDRGLSLKQTARILGIKPKTVENTQRRLFRKLGVENRTQAVVRAHAIGLLDGELARRMQDHPQRGLGDTRP